MKFRLCRNVRGQSLVEFALVLPILLLIIIVLFDLGYAVFIQNMLSSSARQGARAGIIISNSDNVITTTVNAATPGLNPQITISPSPARTFNNPITVTVTYTYVPLTPLLGRITNGIRLSSTSAMIVEGVQ